MVAVAAHPLWAGMLLVVKPVPVAMVRHFPPLPLMV
tara:strand:- start:171 stop:278 length:108 start_codon:yes stop_codon:yes gene_type:complete